MLLFLEHAYGASGFYCSAELTCATQLRPSDNLKNGRSRRQFGDRPARAGNLILVVAPEAVMQCFFLPLTLFDFFLSEFVVF
jgi:hypothetical protein